jgi:hypothetical protein
MPKNKNPRSSNMRAGHGGACLSPRTQEAEAEEL